MAPEQKELLNLRVLPARLNTEQAAHLLGFQPHDLPILCVRGLLKPLGTPPPSAVKYYATSDLEELRADRKWLARATDALHRYWRNKNQRRETPARCSKEYTMRAGEAT